MKAFLLAAGNGTRLKPLTDKTPKCLIEVCDKPMLYWWTRLFLKYGITEVLISTHHLGYYVKKYIYNSTDEIEWTVTTEDKLLGSAGSIRKNKDFVKDEDEFIIAYSDVLTNCNIKQLLDFHRGAKSPFTMVTDYVSDPINKGIVETNQSIITSFEEKPLLPKTNIANMGLYVCTPKVLDLIPDKEYSDIAIDLFPKLIGKMFAYQPLNDYFCDMGTPIGLQTAREQWAKVN